MTVIGAAVDWFRGIGGANSNENDDEDDGGGDEFADLEEIPDEAWDILDRDELSVEELEAMNEMFRTGSVPEDFVDPEMEEVFDTGASLEDIEARIGSLEKVIRDNERDAENAQERYQRKLDESEGEDGYALDRVLREAHESRVEMRRAERRKEEAEDRLEVWRDVKELYELSRMYDEDFDELEGSVNLSDIEESDIIEGAREIQDEKERTQAEIKSMKGELDRVLEWDGEEGRYAFERREAAAHNGAPSVLERDEQLRQDYEEATGETVEIEEQ